MGRLTKMVRFVIHNRRGRKEDVILVIVMHGFDDRYMMRIDSLSETHNVIIDAK